MSLDELEYLKVRVIELESRLKKYTNGENHKRYYEKNKERYKELGSEYLKKLKEENPDKLKEYRKRAYNKRKDKMKLSFVSVVDNDSGVCGSGGSAYCGADDNTNCGCGADENTDCGSGGSAYCGANDNADSCVVLPSCGETPIDNL
jgi:hypothetical protein